MQCEYESQVHSVRVHARSSNFRHCVLNHLPLRIFHVIVCIVHLLYLDVFWNNADAQKLMLCVHIKGHKHPTNVYLPNINDFWRKQVCPFSNTMLVLIYRHVLASYMKFDHSSARNSAKDYNLNKQWSSNSFVLDFRISWNNAFEDTIISKDGFPSMSSIFTTSQQKGIQKYHC